jgi:hypothetical protein
VSSIPLHPTIGTTKHHHIEKKFTNAKKEKDYWNLTWHDRGKPAACKLHYVVVQIEDISYATPAGDAQYYLALILILK